MTPDPTALNAALAADEGFRTEFLAAQSHEQAVEIAARKGWTVTASDLEAIVGAVGKPPRDELSDAELERVSGGTAGVMKTRHDTAKNSIGNIR